MTNWMKWSALALVALVSGCAEERPPRSFVQPNALKKADLEGTFYYEQTVTEAPPTNGAMFIGQSSNLMKIRFDVQEDYLYARRAYEQIIGSEDAHAQDPDNYKGMPLAAWRITSQFDVIRDFNSTTGEQTNRIIESQERPWNQREFIRVDWSQNLVTDYVGIGLEFFFSDGNPQIQPVGYWESDPSKPDAMHLEHLSEAKNGFAAGELVYFDLTNQLIVTPDSMTVSWEEGGTTQSFTMPRCFFSYQTADCASQTVKVRHSFAKVDPTHQYDPRDWDGRQMNMFGVWDVGLRRLAYDRDYGVTNSGAARHAARFNLWETSCRTIDGRQVKVCEAVDAGVDADAPASETRRKVNFVADGRVVGTWKPSVDETDPWTPGEDPRDPRLPWSQRALRTIPYYASGSMPFTFTNDPQFPEGMKDSVYPPELWPQFAEVVRQWDDATRDAVKAMTGTRPEQPVFVPCHNPARRAIPGVQEGDHPACFSTLVGDVDATGSVVSDKQGQPILHARQGDPRNSIVFWVHQQQEAGPLGYGPPLFDEETGETLSGQAYIYGAAIDTYVARSRDLLLLQNGEIDPASFIEGTNVVEAVRAHQAAGTSPAGTIDERRLELMSKAMDFEWAKAFTKENGYPSLDTSSVGGLKKSLDRREKAIHKGYFEHRVDTRESRLSRLAGSPLEKMMSSPEMLASAGISPQRDFDELSPSEKVMASPIRRRAYTEAMRKHRLKAQLRGVDFAQFDDTGIAGHLAKYKKKYGALLAPHADEVLRDLRADIFLGVTLHEVGHNMGCRHNFRGSYDSMNYFPEYWQLRAEALEHPDPGMEAGDGKLHPRYVNKPGGALTKHEIEGGIRDRMYSSIMDYGAEFQSDLNGLGRYDKAFAKFSFGRMVEVFTGVRANSATVRSKLASLQTFQDALGFPSALGAGSGLSAVPYQSYPDLFTNGHAGIYERTDVGFGKIRPRPVSGTSGDTILTDRSGNPLVPYYFCSDEFVGNLTCQVFDAGADAYEQATDIASRYKNFYLLNNFKRDRATFHSSLGYLERIVERYFDPLYTQLTWYVLLRSDFEGYLAQEAEYFDGGNPETNLNGVAAKSAKFFTDENGWGNFTAAIGVGFDTLTSVVTAPQAGVFLPARDAVGNPLWTQLSEELVEYSDANTIFLDQGRFIETTWDFNCGYYWADECQQRIGYFVDKTLALDVLSWSQAYFTGRDTSVDVRRYAIGYVLPFKKQLQEKIGALLSDDLQSFAPYFENDATGRQVVRNPGWLLTDPTVAKPGAIDPATGFTLSLYAGAYALSAYPTTFDHEFLDNSKIFVVGNGEAMASDAEIAANGTSDPAELVSHGGTKQWFTVRDITGRTFAARAIAPASAEVLDVTAPASAGYATKTVPLRLDMGARMLERLKVLGDRRAEALALDESDPSRPRKVAATENEYLKFRQNIEVVRSLHNAFGYGPFMTDAPFYD